MKLIRMRNPNCLLLIALWGFLGTVVFGSSDSPFANPDKPPPKPAEKGNNLPIPQKFKPPVKQQPSPFELRGYYKFEGQWRFYLYNRNDREGAWLDSDENSTAVSYAGETFVFDTENKEVAHEGFQPITLVETPKPTGKAFTPAPAKSSSPAKPKNPNPTVKKPGPPPIPKPRK
ncbi:hypothetical protein OAK38_04555 [Verrucomicrobia bacterium]|nr:hypothetical protein [Verrucomicrobiota bacterium]